MCAFPEVQKKAQQDIDSVVGDGRLPNWEDEAQLPYIRACVDEALRWRTVTILGGIPHAPSQDDVYRDYHIPKGTWITGNLWSIHRNPSEFPEPDVFKPERFITRERPFPNKKGHNAFGWGRRQCSGQPLAEQGLFLTFARLLWAFEIRPGLDANVSFIIGHHIGSITYSRQGKEIPVDIFAYGESENMRPEPFRARFIPRSDRHRELVLSEAKVAREYLRQFDGETKVKMEALEA